MKITFLLALYAVCFDLVAQDGIVITGSISSAGSQQPVPYAHIYIEGTTLGTAANARGEFVLNLPSRYDDKVITFSSVGYASERIPVSSVAHGKPLSVLLIPSAMLLEEVSIKESKQSLIEAAVAAIPKNHDGDAMIMNVFTRALSRQDGNPIQASEAAFQIYRGNVTDKKPLHQLKIIKGRLVRDSAAFDNIFEVNIGTAPSSIFMVDFVHESSILHDAKEMDNFIFDVKGVTRFEDRTVYKIEFDQKDDLKKALRKGVIYLDTASLAFVHITTGFSDKGLPYLTEGFENKAAAKLLGLHKSRWTKRDMTYSYRLSNGKWHLSTVTIQGAFHMIHDKRNLNTTLDMSDLFLITEVVKENIAPFPQEEVARQGRHIEKQ
jgi:hypothetical protein